MRCERSLFVDLAGFDVFLFAERAVFVGVEGGEAFGGGVGVGLVDEEFLEGEFVVVVGVAFFEGGGAVLGGGFGFGGFGVGFLSFELRFGLGVGG